LFFILFVFISLRPIDPIFSDMETYVLIFDQYKARMAFDYSDIAFHYFNLLLSSTVDANTYFMVCAAIYIAPLFLATRKIFKSYWVFGMLFLVGSFSFWSYGTNTIRSGMASSLFIYGLSREKLLSKVVFITLSIGFHFSMIIPATALTISHVYKVPKPYFILWISSIFLSLFAGTYFSDLFAGISAEEDRIGYLSTLADGGIFRRTGFRWDFVAYSTMPILMSIYYIYFKKFYDNFYLIISSLYLITNSAWILIIQVAYTDRFAYLSWFVMGLMISYPPLKFDNFPNRFQHIGVILFTYFSLTYLMQFYFGRL
jgi:hypothetical protein